MNPKMCFLMVYLYIFPACLSNLLFSFFVIRLFLKPLIVKILFNRRLVIQNTSTFESQSQEINNQEKSV